MLHENTKKQWHLKQYPIYGNGAQPCTYIHNTINFQICKLDFIYMYMYVYRYSYGYISKS